MKRIYAFYGFIALTAFAAIYAGCLATQNGGNLDPIMQILAPKMKVLDFDAKTYIDAAATCGPNGANAQAAKDYNAAMLLCNDPTKVVTEVNSTPAGIFITAQTQTAAIQLITAKCTIDGFMPGMAPTIQQTSCPAASPSASPAVVPHAANDSAPLPQVATAIIGTEAALD